MHQLYRFQGGHTYPSYNIKDNSYDIDISRGYTYYSATIYHHKYFTYKRLKQYLNKKLSEAKNIPYSTKMLVQEEYYQKLRKFIASCDMDLFNSIGICCTGQFISLLQENALPRPKLFPEMIERVDRRVFGGGYGLCSEWLELLKSLSLSYSTRRISHNDLLLMIRNIRRNSGPLTESLNFLSNCEREIIINSEIFDDFMKYKIMGLLMSIIEKETCLPNSELAKKPRETIRRVVEDYQKEKETLLRHLDYLDQQHIPYKFTLS